MLPPLDEQSLSDLRHRYDEAPDAETRTRYQMLLLSAKGQTSTQIARLVLRSQDTVVRVLKRFFTGGLDAVPRRTAPADSPLVFASTSQHGLQLRPILRRVSLVFSSGRFFGGGMYRQFSQRRHLSAAEGRIDRDARIALRLRRADQVVR